MSDLPTPTQLGRLAAVLHRRYGSAEAVASLSGHEIDWGNRAVHLANQLAFAMMELAPERVTIGNARRARVDAQRQAAS